MLSEDLDENVLNEVGKSGKWCVSVHSRPGESIEAIAVMAGRPNRQIRVTTAGALREMGFEIDNCREEDWHCDLCVPAHPTEEVWERLRSAFNEPIANPART
jgi:hypothetical protein